MNNIKFIKDLYKNYNSEKFCLYQCFCGKYFKAWRRAVINKSNRSCGCSRFVNVKKVNSTHGYSRTRLYYIWAAIKSRCYKKSNKAFKNYGAKGIVLCKSWHNFANFKKWALKSGYADNLTIDRIDKSKSYKPSNCQWLTKSDNSKKEHKKFYHDGSYYTLYELAKLLDVNYSKLRRRIYQQGWSLSEALYTPSRSGIELKFKEKHE